MSLYKVALHWEIEADLPVYLEVTADYAQSPGNRRGHPDTWTPSYQELDVIRVENERGCPMPALIVERLRESAPFLQAIETLIKEIAT